MADSVDLIMILEDICTEFAITATALHRAKGHKRPFEKCSAGWCRRDLRKIRLGKAAVTFYVQMATHQPPGPAPAAAPERGA